MSQTEPQPPLSSERLKKPLAFEIILARHGAYETSLETDQGNLGLLTPEGVVQSQKLGEQIFQKAVKSGNATDILFVSSPTPYEDKTGQQFGRRADHTADVAMERIVELSGNLPREWIRLLGPVPNEKPKTPYHERLVEPDIHHITSSSTPRAYFQAQVTRFGLRPDESKGTIGRKEGYARGDAEVDAIASQIGAETAMEVGDRVAGVLKDMKHLAEVHRGHYPGRDFIVVLVTHDDVMRSVAQNVMRVGEEAHGYFPENTGTLPIHIEDGNMKLEFKGEVYNKEL